jgi:cytochrome c biogenesis protein CcmG/thiol:disulfide interchange protein DsbE
MWRRPNVAATRCRASPGDPGALCYATGALVGVVAGFGRGGTVESSAAAPTRRRWLRAGAASILVALLLAVFFSAMRAHSVRENPQQGRPAPKFALALFSGSRFESSALHGKIALVNFWASWCPPCRDEAPLLEAKWRGYRDRGLAVLGINVWDTDREARAFLAQYGISFPTGPDPNGRIAISYGVAGIPESYFVDRNGMIALRVPGPLAASAIDAALSRLGIRRP